MSERDEARMETADEQLRTAVQEALAARGYDVGYLVDVVVVAALQHYDEDGDLISSVARVVPGEELPHYRQIGMLDIALTRLRYDYLPEGRIDD